MLLPLPGGRRGLARALLRAAAHACSTPAPRCRRPPGSGSKALARRVRGEAGLAHHRLGLDRDLAGHHQRALEARPRRLIGLPMPGVELKFVPNGDKLEMRVRGVNVFPGYRDAPRAHRAGLRRRRLLPHRRRRLPGRRRTTRAAAWSSTAAWPRTSSSPAAPGCRWARCACAWSRRWRRWRRTWWSPATTASEVGVLVFPTPQAARAAAERAARARARRAAGAARRRRRLVADARRARCCCAEPPSADAGEITDKGYINQRAVLKRRDALTCEALYAGAARRDRRALNLRHRP